MNHSFNTEIALKYGIEEAIMIENTAYWIDFNRSENKNLHDGCYWTFNSSNGLAKFFPYMSAQKIKRVLSNLVNGKKNKKGELLYKGVLRTGNYNKRKYDRTNWYTIIDEDILELYNLPKPTKQAIVQKCTVDGTKINNGRYENVPPIPYINTDINSDINKSITPSAEVGTCISSNLTENDIYNRKREENSNINSLFLKAYELVFNKPHRKVNKDIKWLIGADEDTIQDSFIDYLNANSDNMSKCTIDYVSQFTMIEN